MVIRDVADSDWKRVGDKRRNNWRRKKEFMLQCLKKKMFIFWK